VTGLRIREAARVIVLDDEDRVLLTRFAYRDGVVVWTTVGGGVEPGETYAEAARRELLEEAGLEVAEVGSCIWTRDHAIPQPVSFDLQRERFFLVRAPSFEPAPRLSWAELEAEGMTAIRWWTIDEILAATGTRFGPRRLGPLLRELVRDGPPAEPVDVGI
jgi:ADP-ribose pyrophosphatase YjhB (NUDIX family)